MLFSPEERAAMGWRRLFLQRALRKRCPQCGEGPLFASFARLHANCSVCALQFRREHGSQTGAMYLSATVTEIFAAALALALFFLTDLSRANALILGVSVVVVFSYFMLPITMAIWAAVEYAADVGNSERWTEPRR